MKVLAAGLPFTWNGIVLSWDFRGGSLSALGDLHVSLFAVGLVDFYRLHVLLRSPQYPRAQFEIAPILKPFQIIPSKMAFLRSPLLRTSAGSWSDPLMCHAAGKPHEARTPLVAF